MEVSYCKTEVEEAQQAYEDALEAARLEQESLWEKERDAMDDICDDQLDLEQRQAYRAEYLAQDAADQAFLDAEACGYSQRQAGAIMARTYQNVRSIHHMEMLDMAKVQALHSHHDHANRQQYQREALQEKKRLVDETFAELQRARMRQQNAQACYQTLEQEKQYLKAKVARGELKDAAPDADCSIS